MIEMIPRSSSKVKIHIRPILPKNCNNEIYKSKTYMDLSSVMRKSPKKIVHSEIIFQHNYKLQSTLSNIKKQTFSFGQNKLKKYTPDKFTLFLINNLKKSEKKNDIEQKIVFTFLLSKVDAFEGSDLENNNLEE